MKKGIDEILAARIDEAIDDCVDLAGQLAGQYFQEAFTKKAFDGKAWKPDDDRTCWVRGWAVAGNMCG